MFDKTTACVPLSEVLFTDDTRPRTQYLILSLYDLAGFLYVSQLALSKCEFCAELGQHHQLSTPLVDHRSQVWEAVSNLCERVESVRALFAIEYAKEVCIRVNLSRREVINTPIHKPES